MFPFTSTLRLYGGFRLRVHITSGSPNVKDNLFNWKKLKSTLHANIAVGRDWSRVPRITRKASWLLAQRGALFLVNPPQVFAITEVRLHAPRDSQICLLEIIFFLNTGILWTSFTVIFLQSNPLFRILLLCAAGIKYLCFLCNRRGRQLLPGPLQPLHAWWRRGGAGGGGRHHPGVHTRGWRVSARHSHEPPGQPGCCHLPRPTSAARWSATTQEKVVFNRPAR